MCRRVLLVVQGIPFDVVVSLPSVTVVSGRSGQEGTVNVFVLGHFSPCMLRSVADQAARFRFRRAHSRPLGPNSPLGASRSSSDRVSAELPNISFATVVPLPKSMCLLFPADGRCHMIRLACCQIDRGCFAGGNGRVGARRAHDPPGRLHSCSTQPGRWRGVRVHWQTVHRDPPPHVVLAFWAWGSG